MPLLRTEVPAPVTVLNRADIERTQDLDVADILARTPGVTLSRSGGYGTVASLSIRGADGAHTVVVIDGVKMSDPTSVDNSYRAGNMLLGDISRIEILRGTQSVLWGSAAIGGVINIVTAMPDKPFEARMAVEGGPHDTVNAHADFGGKNGAVAWRLGAETFSTSGISALAPAFGGTEPDGYQSQNISGRTEITLSPDVSIDLRGRYTNEQVDIDGFAGDSSEFSRNRQFVGYVGLNVGLFDGRWRNRLAYNYTDINRKSYDPSRERPLTFDANGRNQRFEYQSTLSVTDGVLALFGAEHEESRFHTVSPAGLLSIPVPEPTRGKIRSTSVYGQLSLTPLKGLTLDGGIRYDHHNRYDSKTLFMAGASWALPTNTVLKISHATGFKAPALYQLFSEFGNVNLGAESTQDWEAGIEQHLFGDALKLGLSWFDRVSTGQVIFQSCLPGNTDPLCFYPGTSDPRFGYYRNLARGKARGFEATGSLAFGRFLFDANYSWTKATDATHGSPTFGNQLARIPRHSANAEVSYAWPIGLTTGAALRWSAKTWDDIFHSIRLPAYALVDLRAEMAISREVILTARMSNVFNKEHMTAYRYNSLGRSLYVGLRSRF